MGRGHFLGAPSRLVLAWKPNSTPTPPTELKVSFTPAEGGTLVDWSTAAGSGSGEAAEATRAGYETGWARVLARFEDDVGTEEVAGRRPR